MCDIPTVNRILTAICVEYNSYAHAQTSTHTLQLQMYACIDTLVHIHEAWRYSLILNVYVV